MDDRDHGGKDLKDCIAGKDWLATQEYIDSGKIGIIGGSYGGFMVLAALAFTPEEFKVGVDLFGMKPGIMIINTSRGGLINTDDMIRGLKSGKVANFGLDVYEQEEKLFFRDLSATIMEDDRIQRLMSFPNVLVTGHQAFFTTEALTEIATVTLNSIALVSAGKADQVAEGVMLA